MQNTEIPQFKRPLYGVIIPMQSESNYFLQHLEDKNELVVNGVKYTYGTISGRPVVFMLSSLGKVNAAALCAAMIQTFHPDLILLAGSSGNINNSLHPGEVVISKSILDADFGKLTKQGSQFIFDNQYLLSPQIGLEQPLIFSLNKRLFDFINKLSKTLSKPEIVLGKIATSDTLPNSHEQIKLLQDNHVDVVEMEGAAVMHTCWIFKTNCIVIRGVSNDAKEHVTLSGIQQAADNASKVAIDIIQQY